MNAGKVITGSRNIPSLYGGYISKFDIYRKFYGGYKQVMRNCA
jgi:hypothetical protein